MAKQMTVTEALLQAITMLDTIAKGGQYDAKEYHDLLHEIRRVHTEAVVEEAERYNDEDMLSCECISHIPAHGKPDHDIITVKVDGREGTADYLVPRTEASYAGKSVLLDVDDGDQYAVVVEVL